MEEVKEFFQEKYVNRGREGGEISISFETLAGSYCETVNRHANNKCYPPIGFSLANMPASNFQLYKLESCTAPPLVYIMQDYLMSTKGYTAPRA